MPALAAAIIGALVSVVGTLIAKALIALGVGVVTYSGITVTLNLLTSMFMSSAGGLPAQVVGILGLLKVGTSFKILTSAVTMKMTMSGVSNTVSRFKVK